MYFSLHLYINAQRVLYQPYNSLLLFHYDCNDKLSHVDLIYTWQPSSAQSVRMNGTGNVSTSQDYLNGNFTTTSSFLEETTEDNSLKTDIALRYVQLTLAIIGLLLCTTLVILMIKRYVLISVFLCQEKLRYFRFTS